MEANKIIAEIERLNVEDKINVLNSTMKFVYGELNRTSDIQSAVNEMIHEYKTNKELTALTALDSEDFYESR
jgi:16S rRNA U1498 N3-methylase RsmE